VGEAHPTSPEPARRRPTAQVTERDLELLSFVAEHRLVLASHVEALLGASSDAVQKRLGALVGLGLLARESVFHRKPACYQITRDGLAMAGSSLPAPRKIDYNCYAHDVGLGWLWLAARQGKFGPVGAIIGEREMRSHDAKAAGGADPLGVRLGGTGPGGRPRLHYPDLLLITPEGHRIAVELELTPKNKARREAILAGYGAERRIDAVLYLAGRPAIGNSVRASARRLGIGPLIHVHGVRWGAERPVRSQLAVPQRAAPQRARPGRAAAEATR
jgi:hypothetical protein